MRASWNTSLSQRINWCITRQGDNKTMVNFPRDTWYIHPVSQPLRTGHGCPPPGWKRQDVRGFQASAWGASNRHMAPTPTRLSLCFRTDGGWVPRTPASLLRTQDSHPLCSLFHMSLWLNYLILKMNCIRLACKLNLFNIHYSCTVMITSTFRAGSGYHIDYFFFLLILYIVTILSGWIHLQ